jgi:rhodanese-related sulfurtransferase
LTISFTVAIAVISGGALLWPALPRAAAAPPAAGDPDDEPRQEHGSGRRAQRRRIRRRPPARREKHSAGRLGKRIGELDKAKIKTVIVVCQSGARADKAVRQLKAAVSTMSIAWKADRGLDGRWIAVNQINRKDIL